MAFCSNTLSKFVERENVVDRVTRYGLEGPGTESRRGQDFGYTSRTSPRPIKPSSTIGTGSLSRRVKQEGRGVDHPPSFSTEVKERVELHLYFRFGHPWTDLG